MRLVLIADDGRERVVRAMIEAKHLTAAAAPSLLDEIEFAMDRLTAPPRGWTSTEILGREA